MSFWTVKNNVHSYTYNKDIIAKIQEHSSGYEYYIYGDLLRERCGGSTDTLEKAKIHCLVYIKATLEYERDILENNIKEVTDELMGTNE